MTGELVPRDWNEAFRYFTTAASSGHSESQCVLATLYWAGYEVPRIKQKAIELWEESAKSGIPYSIFMLHYAVKKTSKEDADKAFQQLLQLGETGNLRDKWRLGRIYHAGHGVARNAETCLYWHSKAAERGWAGNSQFVVVFNSYLVALNNVGLCYELGFGVPSDSTVSFKYFLRAAEQDYSVACYNVGMAFKEGRGVEVDGEKALYWLRKAAERESCCINKPCCFFKSVLSRTSWNRRTFCKRRRSPT